MANAEAKVTSKGQITLPLQVRKRLNVGPGDRVVFVEAGDGDIVVRARSGTLADMRGMLRSKARPAGPATIGKWIDAARSRALPPARGRRKPR